MRLVLLIFVMSYRANLIVKPNLKNSESDRGNGKCYLFLSYQVISGVNMVWNVKTGKIIHFFENLNRTSYSTRKFA